MLNQRTRSTRRNLCADCGLYLKEPGMTKIVVIAVAVGVLVLVGAVLAQTSAHRPAQAARPNTNAPTKVTGDGVKAASGLQYWDIKVGTGAVAKEAVTSKCTTPDG
jgi:hypothetical protein